MNGFQDGTGADYANEAANRANSRLDSLEKRVASLEQAFNDLSEKATGTKVVATPDELRKRAGG